MFEHWTPSDWLGLAAIIVPLLFGGIWHAWRTAKTLGAFEVQHETMRKEITELKRTQERMPAMIADLRTAQKDLEDVKTELGKYASVDRSLAVLQEGMRTVAAGLTEFKADITDQLKEVRHDVRNLMTGKIQPARRGRQTDA